MKKQTSRTSNGFTLVELLVVIVIIVALAALSMSVMTRMRNAGDIAAAVGSLRQLQTANASYASEHAGRYASYEWKDDKGTIVRWYDSANFLVYFTGNETQLLDPSTSPTVQPSLLDPTVVRAKKRLYDKIAASYGMSHDWMTPIGPDANGVTEKYTTVTGVKNSNRTAVFISATDGAAKYNGRQLWKGAAAVEGKTTDGKMAFRHQGKAVVVYYDGSVGTILMQDLVRFDANGGKSNVFWNGTI